MIFDLFFGGRQSRVNINDIAFDLNDPASVNEILGGESTSDSGAKVSAAKSLTLAAVWQGVQMISGDLAKLPLDLYKRQPNGDRAADAENSAYQVVRRRANPEQSAFDFWRKYFFHALLWNNAYAFVDKSGDGSILGLYHLLPDRTCAERWDGKKVYVTETGGTLVEIPAGRVIHISNGISLDTLEGYSHFVAAREAYGLSLSAQKFAARFFKHGVRAGGILEVPVGFTPTAANKLEEGFRKHHEGEDNWFKTVILRDGSKFHQTSIPPEAAQMVDVRDQQVREVARYLNLSPSKLGLSDSVSYNSKAEDNRNYLDTTLSPWLSALCAELWMKLLTTDQQNSDSHFFEHNSNALLMMSADKRYQVYAIGLRNRFLRPNEVRSMENLPRYDGGDEFIGDQPAPPVAGSSDGGADKTTTAATDSIGNVGDVGGSAGGTRSAHSLRRVVFGLGDHARKKSTNPRAFVEWIDGGIPSHRSAAADLLGDDTIVERFLVSLREVAQRATAAELVSAVEKVCTEFETGV
jgi:HK97 family phage portal protein